MADDRPLDPRPLLIAADWQSRALLLAELAERGIDARSEAGVQWTVRALLTERLAPPLLFLDTRDDPHATPEKLRRLLGLLEQQPYLILLTSVYERGLWEDALTGDMIILTRPRTIGDLATHIVEAVNR